MGKSKKTASLKSLGKDAASALRRKDPTPHVAELLEKAPEALAELERLSAVSRLAAKGHLEALGLLLDRGADPNHFTPETYDPALHAVAKNQGLSLSAKRPLFERLLAAGADIALRDESAWKRTVLDLVEDIELLVLLLGYRPPQQVVINAAKTNVQRSISQAAQSIELLRRLCDDIADMDQPGTDGWSALHTAAHHGAIAAAELLLEKGADPNARTTMDHTVGLERPGSGVVHRNLLPRGMTALDLVERHLQQLTEDFEPAEELQPHDTTRYLALRDRLLAFETRLHRLGATRGEANPANPPAFKVEIDGWLARVIEAGGADAAGFLEQAGRVDYTRGSWRYLVESIERAYPTLSGCLLAADEDSWLGGLIRDVPEQRRAARAPVDQVQKRRSSSSPFFTGSGLVYREDATLCLVRRDDTFTLRVANATELLVIGEDPTDFVRRECARALGLEVPPPAPFEAAQGEPRLLRLRADYESHLRGEHLARLGGPAVGVSNERWPRYRGEPMTHLLTFDLADHPSLSTTHRAIALFAVLPNEDNFDRWVADGGWTRTLLLDEADIATGASAPPAGVQLLPEGRLHVEPAPALDASQWIQVSFVAASGIWMHDEAPSRAQSAGNYVLQFGHELVPSLGLGDTGVMYVFTDDAWVEWM